MLNDTNVTDMETCYKVFTAEALRSIPLESNRFASSRKLPPRSLATASALSRFRSAITVALTRKAKKSPGGMVWPRFVHIQIPFQSPLRGRWEDGFGCARTAPRFNRWMYETIQPALGDRVAELGSGRGNISKLLRDRKHLLLTDYRVDYLEDLSRRWGSLPHVRVDRLICWIQAITRP